MMDAIVRRWHHPTRYRYYSVYIARNLWREWELTRCWGSQVSKQGGFEHLPCTSYNEAMRKLETIVVRRKQHGYIEN